MGVYFKLCPQQKEASLKKVESHINLWVLSWVFREQSHVILYPFSNIIIIGSAPRAYDLLWCLSLPPGFSHWFKWKLIFAMGIWFPQRNQSTLFSEKSAFVSFPLDSWCQACFNSGCWVQYVTLFLRVFSTPWPDYLIPSLLISSNSSYYSLNIIEVIEYDKSLHHSGLFLLSTPKSLLQWVDFCLFLRIWHCSRPGAFVPTVASVSDVFLMALLTHSSVLLII